MGIVSRDYQYGARSKEDIKRVPLTLIMLGLAYTGIFWLSANDIQAGETYSKLFLYGISMVVLMAFFTKSSDSPYEIPIATRFYDSVVFYVFGLALPMFLFSIPQLFGAKAIVTAKAFVPLTFSTGVAGAQTFAAISTIADPFWRSFIIVFTAGTIEPWAVGFASVAFGVMLGYTIRKLLGVLPKGLDLGSGMANKIFDFSVAMIWSIGFFVVIHKLNGSYVSVSMFIAAGVFRFLMNLSLYQMNLSLAFLFGFHQMNNAISIGLKYTVSGFLSHPFGWFILFMFGAIFLSFFVNIKKFPDVFKRLWAEIGL